MKRILLLTSLIALSACGDAGQRTERVGEGLKENYHNTSDRIAAWMEPTPKPQKHEVPTSYCYQTYQDILCYRQPMPGSESRLVGYQGSKAAPPPPAMMKPLPVRAAGKDMLPESRAKTSKPLVTAVPPQPAKAVEGEPTVQKTLAVDPAHESLPDPTLTPQM